MHESHSLTLLNVEQKNVFYSLTSTTKLSTGLNIAAEYHVTKKEDTKKIEETLRLIIEDESLMLSLDIEKKDIGILINKLVEFKEKCEDELNRIERLG